MIVGYRIYATVYPELCNALALNHMLESSALLD